MKKMGIMTLKTYRMELSDMSDVLTYKEVLIAIIKAIDMVNFLLKDHHRRVAVIAYHLGHAYGLSAEEMERLVIAACVGFGDEA